MPPVPAAAAATNLWVVRHRHISSMMHANCHLVQAAGDLWDVAVHNGAGTDAACGAAGSASYRLPAFLQVSTRRLLLFFSC